MSTRSKKRHKCTARSIMVTKRNRRSQTTMESNTMPGEIEIKTKYQCQVYFALMLDARQI